MFCSVWEDKVVNISVAKVPALDLILEMAKHKKSNSHKNSKDEKCVLRDFH